MATNKILVAGAGAVAAYYFWPQISAMFSPSTPPPQTGPPSTVPPGTPQGAQGTTYSPITNPPGVPIGNGCYSYAGNISCPPGVSPPATNPPATPGCQPGYTLDASGLCTEYTDATLLAYVNSIPWSGSTNIPTEQINRIDAQIIKTYTSYPGVTPGSVLAYLLGLGGTAAEGTSISGSDGSVYVMTNGVFVRQPNGKLSGVRGIQVLASALPITNETLMQAAIDPNTATIIDQDPRAQLTVPQWNYFYSQASGVLQTQPTHQRGASGQRISPLQYHALRLQAGVSRMGTIHTAPKGAFPNGPLAKVARIGTITSGPSRIAFSQKGNRNIFRIPGQGVAVQRMGTIQQGGGDHRWQRSPFPRPSNWREAGR